jgi:hypothetical protein
MKNKFNEYSKREREMLELISPSLNLKIESTTDIDGYDSFDFTGYINRQYILGEIKCRDFEHNKYPTAYLELDKLNRIMDENKEAYIKENRIPHLLCFYNDGIALLFNLMDTPITIEYKWAWKCTADKSKGKTHKAFIALPIEKAQKINMNGLQ